jgi:hypothetical protein
MRKPTNCKCGNYHEAGHRWVVIDRRPSPRSSQLKCLACGWKWFSTCNYVAKLDDHVEVSFKGMTDQDILDRIVDGSLTVFPTTAEVWSYSSVTKAWTKLRIIERESSGSTYRFVEICKGMKKKKIALHRLVWISYHRQIVPEGYDVDHIEGKSREFPDSIDNLQLLESRFNRSRGKPFVSQSAELPF